MNICIIGDGLSSLSLAKNLTKKKINVHLYQHEKIKNYLSSRIIGISKNNLNFFKKEICEIPKRYLWKIEKIEIYSQKAKNEKILNFENNEEALFFNINNDELYNLLTQKLSKNKFFEKKVIKNKFFYKKLITENKYDLIINCERDNFLLKKYFVKKFDKDYKNLAYTTTLQHDKLGNNIAIQIFTKFGPIAFLPISKTKTSVVFSLDIKSKDYSNNEVLALIKKYNPKYKIKKIQDLNIFKLKSSNLRNYYYKNILVFGDLLHRIHPLAGQGFNMTIRDIKTLSEIVQSKIDLGLQLDSLIPKEFEKKTKHKNLIFSHGIDFIYEVFNFNKQIKNKNLNKIFKFLGKKKTLTNFLIKFADRGFNI